MRQKFYHGKPPEREVAAYQREVGANLVNRVLLLDEARRRNLAPDKAEVTKVIDGYDQRYKDSAQWKANRERLLPDLVAQLEGNTLLRALEQQVRAVAAPSERQVREYYAAHSDQFTEPDQIRLSIILLRVDPSSPKSAWEKAREEAEGIHRRLQRGSSFAELARMHSNDNSAANGGDVGYVHRGMLPEAIQEQVVDKLSTGQVSGPIPLLEGIAIVRVEDRKAAKLRSFEDVRARAADLWRRDQGEAAWTALIANLRRKATIRVDESRYLPLDAPVAQPAPGGRG
jgi:parvulin-like peptidyl-prolyl isomerase